LSVTGRGLIATRCTALVMPALQFKEETVAKIEVTEELRWAVCEAVADALGEAYDCTRVWSAWSYDTMGPDDFSLVAENDSRLAEIADAAIKVLTE
jgi:hypothetical protein